MHGALACMSLHAWACMHGTLACNARSHGLACMGLNGEGSAVHARTRTHSLVDRSNQRTLDRVKKPRKQDMIKARTAEVRTVLAECKRDLTWAEHERAFR